MDDDFWGGDEEGVWGVWGGAGDSDGSGDGLRDGLPPPTSAAGHGLQTVLYPEDLEHYLDAPAHPPHYPVSFSHGGVRGSGGSHVATDDAYRYLPPEAQRLRMEAARLQRGTAPLLTPLLEMERRLVASARERMKRNAERDAAASAATLFAAHERAWVGGDGMVMAADGSVPMTAEEARQYVAEVHAAEVRQLEERLAEASVPSHRGRRAARGGGGDLRGGLMAHVDATSGEAASTAAAGEGLHPSEAAAAEAAVVGSEAAGEEGMREGGGEDERGDVVESSVCSMVQHLSSFGLNRNLPWQIYATRPKRFARAHASQHSQMAMSSADGHGGGSGYAGGRCDVASNDAYAADFPGGGARAVARSVYDQPARPARRQSPRRAHGRPVGASLDEGRDEGLPPIRGAVPIRNDERFAMARPAWPSPRR